MNNIGIVSGKTVRGHERLNNTAAAVKIVSPLKTTQRAVGRPNLTIRRASVSSPQKNESGLKSIGQILTEIWAKQ